jgi:hypothetical protein
MHKSSTNIRNWHLKSRSSGQWQLGKVVINPLALSVARVILDWLQQSHAMLSLSPRIIFRVQKAVILNTRFIVRILLNNEDHLTDD